MPLVWPDRDPAGPFCAPPGLQSCRDRASEDREVTLGNVRTPVPLAGSQPVEYVLLWINELSGGDGAYSSEISEVELRAAQASSCRDRYLAGGVRARQCVLGLSTSAAGGTAIAAMYRAGVLPRLA